MGNGTTQLHTVELGDRQDGLMLAEYNGIIQINRYFQGSDGKNYPKMCYPKTKAGPSEKVLPMGINLGKPVDAVRLLTQFLHVLKRANGLA